MDEGTDTTGLPVIEVAHEAVSTEQSPKRRKRRRVFQAPVKSDAAVDQGLKAGEEEDDFFNIGRATRLRAEAEAEAEAVRRKEREQEERRKEDEELAEQRAAAAAQEDEGQSEINSDAENSSHFDKQNDHSVTAFDESIIDEHGLMDSSDIEILGESEYQTEQQHVSLQEADIASPVTAAANESRSMESGEGDVHDAFSDKLKQFLAMGLDRATATSMVEHLRRQKASFSVTIQVRAYQADLQKFDNSFEIKSTDKFEVLKQQYMAYLESEGITSRDPLHQHANRCIFVASTIAIGLDASPSTINVRRSDPNVVLQLMTPEEQAESKRLREEARLKAIEAKNKALEEEQEENNEHDEEDGGQEEQSAPQSGSFPVLLRGADNVEHKVRVRPETEIQKLVDFYKSKMGLDQSVNITLEFDNEKLDPKSTIADTELEEDDNIDVFIK